MVSVKGKRGEDNTVAAKQGTPSVNGKQRRGFAAMSPEKQRELAQKGGLAASAAGTAHRYTSEEARAAGRKGGPIISRDRAYMAEIGRKGGKAAQAAKTQPN
jgi:general stress protein YciG